MCMLYTSIFAWHAKIVYNTIFTCKKLCLTEQIQVNFVFDKPYQ